MATNDQVLRSMILGNMVLASSRAPRGNKDLYRELIAYVDAEYAIPEPGRSELMLSLVYISQLFFMFKEDEETSFDLFIRKAHEQMKMEYEND